jgi:hypothetical protein
VQVFVVQLNALSTPASRLAKRTTFIVALSAKGKQTGHFFSTISVRAIGM